MSDLVARLEAVKSRLKVDEKRARLARLRKDSENPALWEDWQRGQTVMKELAGVEETLRRVDDLGVMLELEDFEEAENELGKLELQAFLSGDYDQNGAFLSIHSGQGGTEAMDWAAMLARMYQRFAESRHWKVTKLDESPGEEAGIKSITYQIDGPYAYGYLKGEAGTHRLVRQSPFNADNLRQTSFARVEVTPAVDDDVPVVLNPEEITFEAFRASGHGGQNVNKVSTAVRLTHQPTGLIVECQTERSQQRNRELAMGVLRSRLLQLELEKKQAEQARLKGEYQVPGWGHQIRSYVLHPYKLVKDLRTEVESTNPTAVLDGDLEPFIAAELRAGLGVV